MWLRCGAVVGLLMLMQCAGAQVVRVLLDERPHLLLPVVTEDHREEWNVTASGGRLTVNGETLGETVEVPELAETVLFEGKRYRGTLTLRAKGSQVQSINTLDIEDYLRGVVPAEMPPLWPSAALEAQAIVSRSYVLARLNTSQSHDICASTACQRYGGMNAEHPSSDAAVWATSSQVLRQGGRVAEVYFSAHSGGHTASARETWGRAAAHLPGVSDPHSLPDERRWTKEISPAQFAAAARQSRLNVAAPQRLEVLSYSDSGRPERLRVSGVGTATLQGPQAVAFVRALGAPSAKLQVKNLGGGALRLSGEGAGHGVGLSQHGARAMALEGFSSAEIVQFYFPTLALERM